VSAPPPPPLAALQDRVDRAVLERFPGYRWGKVVVAGVDNSVSRPEIAARARRAGELLRAELGAEDIVAHPVVAAWRAAFAAFGARPSKYQSSIEALVRRVRRGDELPAINPLVDLYNAVSVETLLPIGGDDLDLVSGATALRLARGDEDYLPLGEETPSPPEPGEVIYADDATVLCRRWCWRQGERTKITAATRDVVLNVHGLPPGTREQVERACRTLAEEVPRLLGGAATWYVLDAAAPSRATDLVGLRAAGG
jgi:lysyl-tRNA synthetase class 2